MNLLVTGGAGFIGSNFVRHILGTYRDYKVINLDLLTYAGNIHNLDDLKDNPNHLFVKGNITDRALVQSLIKDHDIQAIINLCYSCGCDLRAC